METGDQLASLKLAARKVWRKLAQGDFAGLVAALQRRLDAAGLPSHAARVKGANSRIADDDPLRFYSTDSHNLGMARRWDKEWIAYFRRAPNYFQDMSTPNDDVRNRLRAVASALANEDDLRQGFPATSDNPIWKIWLIAAYPSEIKDKWVADLGCGPGGIGRTLGYIASRYVGIDYAPLALYVAKLVSPPSCTYLARFETERIAEYGSKIDTVFSRKVFIHQNFEEASKLVRLASDLLKPDGVLIGDFFNPNKDSKDPNEREISRYAKDDLDPDRPTVGFYFTDQDLEELAASAGLGIEAMQVVPEHCWKLVRFRKQSAASTSVALTI